MIDGIIKADGTSRLIRAELPATYEEFRAQCHAGVQPLDVLFNAIGWSQLPTFLNKRSLLTDATAALFDLGADAVPNDVFNLLSRFQSGLGNEYVWSKAGLSIVANELIKKLKISIGSETVQYSSTCAISGTSVVLTGDVRTKAVNYGEDYSWLANKYFIPSYGDRAGQVLYSTVSPYEDSASPGWVFTDATLVKVNADSLSYVNSPYENAYPIDDGYTYTALGQLGAKVQIATGSYTGTGTYGEANKNVLKLDFEPKLVFLAGVGIGDHGYALSGQSIFNHWNNGNYAGNTQLPHGCSCEFNGDEFKYYNGSQAAYQFNISGRVYNYIVFG